METLFEELPELCVEDGVDDGVEGAVDVAEPRHHAHQGRRDVAVVAAGSRGVEDKEGGPAEQEGTCRKRGRRRRRIRKVYFPYTSFGSRPNESVCSIYSTVCLMDSKIYFLNTYGKSINKRSGVSIK